MNIVGSRYCDLRVAFVIAFAPAVLLAIDLMQKNPPVRPADADTAVAIWDIDLNMAKQPRAAASLLPVV